MVPRYENTVADSLAVVAGKFKTPSSSQKKYQVDIVNRPSIPNNSKYWQVFEDDMQIKIFLEFSSEFVNTHIDAENDNSESFQDVEENEEEKTITEKLKGTLGGKDVIQLKSNFIPRGLIPLEKLFDQNDVAKDPKEKLADNAIEDRNIGTKENPKIVKLSKNFLAKEKEEYVDLMQKYTNVFSWSYEDLK